MHNGSGLQVVYSIGQRPVENAWARDSFLYSAASTRHRSKVTVTRDLLPEGGWFFTITTGQWKRSPDVMRFFEETLRVFSSPTLLLEPSDNLEDELAN